MQIPLLSDIIKQFEAVKDKFGDVHVEFFWKPTGRPIRFDLDLVSMDSIHRKEPDLFYILLDKDPNDYNHLGVY